MGDSKRVYSCQVQEYDCLRVILTLLVVAGHCTYYKIVTPYGGCDYSFLVGTKSEMFCLLEILTSVIYHFHMPLFMCLSGALFYISIRTSKYISILSMAEDKAKKLLIPFLCVSIFYSFPIKYWGGIIAKAIMYLKILLLASCYYKVILIFGIV